MNGRPLMKGEPLRRPRQRGLSLVELMRSIVLGLLIVAAVIGVYLESKRNYAAEEEVARIQEMAATRSTCCSGS